MTTTNQITENYVEIAPAYGRDYKSKKEVEQDFRAGKDFQMMSIQYGSGYCSIRDFAPGTTVNLRYKRMTMVSPVKV